MERSFARALCVQPSAFYKIAQKKMVYRNAERVEWYLVALVDLSVGTFLGFYTGDFSLVQKTSLYAAQVDRTFIYPFPDEDTITREQREARPFANMNEPVKGSHANCCMIVQDFDETEVVDGDCEEARFYRGLACYTCADVKAGDELTWYYGKSYDAARGKQGYEAGNNCKRLLNKQVFIPSRSQGVLRIIPKVSKCCVFPVTGRYKSERFAFASKKRKRKHAKDEETSSNSSSGSGHIPKYVPSSETREQRLRHRSQKR